MNPIVSAVSGDGPLQDMGKLGYVSNKNIFIS